MAFVITPEISLRLEEFNKLLNRLENIKCAFCSAPPNVDAGPFQYLIEETVDDLMQRFDACCTAIGLPN